MDKTEEYYDDDLPTTEDEETGPSESEDNAIGDIEHPTEPQPIRWRKGELIGAGAYGRVHLGMNLESGELIAVKQVLIASNSTTKEKAQEQVRELEQEVANLRGLSHPNIVRYLGTAKEEGALNIFLEFVPGGSIATMLQKFGCFNEKIIRVFTRQLMLGLEYLHANSIMHRDIKGANILMTTDGCIKLADFGASKKLADLQATMSEGYKSMKGTPYWMAPEVIKQTGHGRQADIWSVGCTVIEMATGKPPWSQFQSQVSALFHIAQAKTPPPIPENLSLLAKEFLLLCLRRDPKKRPSASALLKHPFLDLSMPPTRSAPDTTLPTTYDEKPEAKRDAVTLGADPSQCSILPRRSIAVDTTGSGVQAQKAGTLSRVQKELQNGARAADDTVSRRALQPRYSNRMDDHPLAARVSKPQQDYEEGGESGGYGKGGMDTDVTGSGGAPGPVHSRRFSDLSILSDTNPMAEPSYVENSGGSPNGWNASDHEVNGPSHNGNGHHQHALDSSPASPDSSRLLEAGGLIGGRSARSQSPNTISVDAILCASSASSLPINIDEDLVTEEKIKGFLAEKALELKRLQTPLLEQLLSIRQTQSSLPHPPPPLQSSPRSPPLKPRPRAPEPESRPCEVAGRTGGGAEEPGSETDGTGGTSPSGSSIGRNPLSWDRYGGEVADSLGPLRDAVGTPRSRIRRAAFAPDAPGRSEGERKPLPTPAAGGGEEFGARGSLKKQQWEEELQAELASKREEKRRSRGRNSSGSGSGSGSEISPREMFPPRETYFRSVRPSPSSRIPR